MIPKIINYCWFGKNPLPSDVQKTIEMWRRLMPGYELRQWDETNFDVNTFKYTHQAYYAKRYAFVSDVARLYALKTVGGIYFDTDIILKKAIPNAWLNYKAFTSFEHDKYIQTGVMACEPNHPIIEEFYRSYEKRHFMRGMRYDLTTNVYWMTALMKKHGFKMNNQFQIRNGFAVFPQVILSAKDWIKGKYDTDETVAMHDFAGTWGKDALNNKFKFYINMACTIIGWQILGKRIRF